MFKDVARVVLYKSHSVMRQQVSMYGFVHVLPLPVVRSYWLCPKQKSLPSLRGWGWGDMFWKGGSPGCPLCGPVPVNGMVYVIQSCSNSLALAPVIKQFPLSGEVRRSSQWVIQQQVGSPWCLYMLSDGHMRLSYTTLQTKFLPFAGPWRQFAGNLAGKLLCSRRAVSFEWCAGRRGLSVASSRILSDLQFLVVLWSPLNRWQEADNGEGIEIWNGAMVG